MSSSSAAKRPSPSLPSPPPPAKRPQSISASPSSDDKVLIFCHHFGVSNDSILEMYGLNLNSGESCASDSGKSFVAGDSDPPPLYPLCYLDSSFDRRGAFCVFEGYLYFFGGMKNLCDWVSDVYKYPVKDIFQKQDELLPKSALTPLPKMGFAKVNPAAVHVGRYICVFSMLLCHQGRMTRNFELFDPIDQSWSSLPEPVDYPANYADWFEIESYGVCASTCELIISTSWHSIYFINLDDRSPPTWKRVRLLGISYLPFDGISFFSSDRKFCFPCDYAYKISGVDDQDYAAAAVDDHTFTDPSWYDEPDPELFPYVCDGDLARPDVRPLRPGHVCLFEEAEIIGCVQAGFSESDRGRPDNFEGYPLLQVKFVQLLPVKTEDDSPVCCLKNLQFVLSAAKLYNSFDVTCYSV